MRQEALGTRILVKLGRRIVVEFGTRNVVALATRMVVDVRSVSWRFLQSRRCNRDLARPAPCHPPAGRCVPRYPTDAEKGRGAGPRAAVGGARRARDALAPGELFGTAGWCEVVLILRDGVDRIVAWDEVPPNVATGREQVVKPPAVRRTHGPCL